MKIDTFIDENKMNINQQYRHQYHLMAPVGWINDPNGFCYYKGNYHMFYQYYPYDTKWGLMHWGHAISDDMISWKALPVALTPSKVYDQSGIFSGSSIEIDNNLYVYYTGHYDSHMNQKQENKKEIAHIIKQVQCLAISKDGINFEKFEHNPIIGLEQIPQKTRISDFRDPKVWKNEETYYMAVGSGNNVNSGEVLFFKSINGKDWEYLNKFCPDGEYGYVCECPDLFELGGKSILIVSFQGKSKQGYKFQNLFCVIAFIGSFDYSTGIFSNENEVELDAGFDFYAPQSILDPLGRRVMTAFMHMFQRTSILDELKHGWIGSLTLPRTLHLENGKIFQKPIEEIKRYRHNEVILNSVIIDGEKKIEGICGTIIEMEIALIFEKGTIFEIEFFKSDKESLRLILNRNDGIVTLDRSNTEKIIESINRETDYSRTVELEFNDKISIHCFLDVSSIEIFLNEGKKVITSLFYSSDMGHEIGFNTDGKVLVETIKKWDLILN